MEKAKKGRSKKEKLISSNIRLYALLFQCVSQTPHFSVFEYRLRKKGKYKRPKTIESWSDPRSVQSDISGEYVVPRTLIVTSTMLYLVDEDYSMWHKSFDDGKKKKKGWFFSSGKSSNSSSEASKGSYSSDDQFVVLARERMCDISEVLLDRTSQESFSIFFNHRHHINAKQSLSEWRFVSPQPGQSAAFQKLQSEIRAIKFGKAVKERQ